jgi:hypothetical protein
MKTSVLLLVLLPAVVIMGAGCAHPSIVVSTTPSRAAISVNNAYIGDSPVVYNLTDEDVDREKIHIRAAKEGYEPVVRVAYDEPAFPDRVHIVLEDAAP